MISIIVTTLAILSPTARHWSIYTVNNTELVSNFLLNSHHTNHIVYAVDDNDRLFALITFKEAKRLNDIYRLYGKEISAEPQPKPRFLKGNPPTSTIINRNVYFMQSNFNSISELI